MPELSWDGMAIHQAIKSDWKTPELLIEGALSCGKTTVVLDKEVDAIFRWPGIKSFGFRWIQDSVDTKLRPAFEEILAIRGVPFDWDQKQKTYTFKNGSVVFMFGLKTVSQIEMFNKIRGLGVSRIFGDQVEEIPQAVSSELRFRLRPDLTASTKGIDFPRQLTYVSNPEDHDFWLSKEFPYGNAIKGRVVHSLSLFDNPRLPEDSIETMLRTYPPDHPKYITMVMGRRGPNILGVPIFEGLYRKADHWKPATIDMESPVYEAYEVGKHNPVWLVAQRLYGGGLNILCGVRGEGLVLEQFLPLVSEYRQQWIPKGAIVRSCTAPMGDKITQAGLRYTVLDIMRRHRITPTWKENSNAPDVRLAMIENIAAYLRATGDEAALVVNNDPTKFVIVSRDGPRESPFVHHAFEGGYVWDPHFVSVSHKEMRQPREDDKFANVMHAIEDIELNFCAGRLTQEQRDTRRVSAGPLTPKRKTPSQNSWMY